jgi:energy-coupling factor transporter ATP-binding protein EcfA2
MKLISIRYSEFKNQPKEWTLEEITFDQITLVVGKNASGKTRTLNIINNLARLIRGDIKPTFDSAYFDASFNHEGDDCRYRLFISNGNVVEENFESKGKIHLTRGQEGIGKIFAHKLNKEIDFQTPPSDIALTSRRDNIQHPFFEPLFNWAFSVYHYAFGTPLGRDIFFTKDNVKYDPRNTFYVIPIYKQGEVEFGASFKDAIKNDLKTIGYDISDIGLAAPTRVTAAPSVGELEGLWVQENDLKGKVEQENISQGMFRALSLIIQLNYSKIALKPACILIDDIGEGLDFERSCSLINLLLEKVKETSTQLVMTTNDRFVMNNIPLDMWTVLNRQGSHCKVTNIHNAKDKFKKFRFTGLNNFDFFATDYLNQENK